MAKLNKIILGKTDFTHYRLSELVSLADSAFPFYLWVEKRGQSIFKNFSDLNSQLLSLDKKEIKELILNCFSAKEENIPKIFDGKGDEYAHKKACFYFFSWIVRDAPQQRLSRLISEYRSNGEKKMGPDEAIAEVISNLIIEYRSILKTFEWSAVREVLIDRLEGSRRAIKGSMQELIARRGVAVALSTFYKKYSNYGEYNNFEISKGQIKIGKHTYDVCISLLSSDKKRADAKVYVPVKTRETRGGGHAHLFTRDILEAARALKITHPEAYIIPLIIAADWSKDEEEIIRGVVDDLIIIRENPGAVESLPEESQMILNNAFDLILTNKLKAK